MKIAQLAPPWLPVPPTGYGGTETIVYYLTEGLVKRGHDVTLFASGDSQTSAHLFSVFPKALGNSGEVKKDSLHALLHYIECFDRADEFDMIHNHAQYYAMFLADLVKTPVIHTIHGSFSKEYTPEEKIHTLERFKYHKFISISNNQRKDLEKLNYVATVYNGVDVNNLQFSQTGGDHLLWFGRITEKKGPIDAIQVAKRLNKKIVLAGAIDDIDLDFFKTQVFPLVDNKLVFFEKEIPFDKKSHLFGNASCVLYPISWEEPFGLVMTEAMSCGTPVIAYSKGSVPEIIKDGGTGYIVNASENDKRGDWIIKKTGIDGLAEAVERIYSMNATDYQSMRQACRTHVENNFTIEKMVDNYEAVYKEILTGK